MFCCAADAERMYQQVMKVHAEVMLDVQRHQQESEVILTEVATVTVNGSVQLTQTQKASAGSEIALPAVFLYDRYVRVRVASLPEAPVMSKLVFFLSMCLSAAAGGEVVRG